MTLLQLLNSSIKNFCTRILPKKLKDFANEQQVKHTSTVMEHSNPFNTLVKLVDAEGFTNEKTRTLDLPLEINNITSNLEPEILSSEIMIQILKL